MTKDIVSKLAATIRGRRHSDSDASYTKQLLTAGPERCARKFGEEAVELLIASLGTDPKALASEAADVVFHLLVLLEARGVRWSDVAQILEQRTSQSGLAEKAARAMPED